MYLFTNIAAFGVIFLGEPLSWRLVVGACLIFGSGVGLNLLPAPKAP